YHWHSLPRSANVRTTVRPTGGTPPVDGPTEAAISSGIIGGPVPTYSYACTACGHTFDIRQSFTDESLTVCPECEGRLRKVLGNVGVVFKGSGFYRTDSRTTASASLGASKPSGSSSSGSSSSGSSSSGS